MSTLTLSCTDPPALKGPFITPGIISDDFDELKLFIALAWDCDWDDIDNDDNDVILLLWLFPTPDDDNEAGDAAVTDVGSCTVSLPPRPLLSNGAVWRAGMEGFPTLWLETEFTVEFIEVVPILFTNTLLDTLVFESPDTWLLNTFDWLFESENNKMACKYTVKYFWGNEG